MKLPVFAVIAAASLLTGCTSSASLLADREKGPSPIEQANAYVPVSRPLPADFCDRVGLDARLQALHAGFDASSQEHLAQQSMQQCALLTTTQVAGL